MKKLLSILLAVSLLFALAIPAFADGEKKDEDPSAALTELLNKDELTDEDLNTALQLLGDLIVKEATGGQPAEAVHEISSAEIPLYANTEETGINVPLYFLDGVKDLPYVNADGLLFLLEGLMDFQCKLSADGPVLTVNRHSELFDADIPMTIDFDRNVIFFPDYDLFCVNPGASSIMDTTRLTGFNAEGEPSILQKVDNGSLIRYGKSIEIDLGNYGIDLIQQDGQYLIPLQTVADLLIAPNAMKTLFFNGQSVIYSGDISDCADLYYAAPTGERSDELTQFGYSELCMMLDTIYGLKETHEIETFDQLFDEVGFKEFLLGPEVKQADAAIYRLITDYLDDNHSKFLGFSYLTGPVDYEVTGVSRARMGNFRQRQLDAREKFYPDGVPGYEEIGNTAYITLDGFDLYGDPDAWYSVEDPMDLPDEDAIALIMKAHALINRENSPVENVVLDLSINGGGVADAAVFTVAWLLGEASIGAKNTMTGAMGNTFYRADVNRDRVFDEKDTLQGKRLFCMTSSFSFSNGNMVPCMLKESGVVTMLGRTSGGGSCNIQPMSSAWGTSFQISGTNRASFLKNGSFYDVDRGADPDYTISEPERYYDRTALTDYINSIY
ncbi:MAG: hypothetical protein IKS55_03045 [Oscillospiraceae bacterium]|nr:hypothetical protein [Oscillospiraceae bacterium]